MRGPARGWTETSPFEGMHVARAHFPTSVPDRNMLGEKIDQGVRKRVKRAGGHWNFGGVETHQSCVYPFGRGRIRGSGQESRGYGGIRQRTFALAAYDSVGDRNHVPLRRSRECAFNCAVAQDSLQIKAGTPDGV